jgi:hypothetical protein
MTLHRHSSSRARESASRTGSFGATDGVPLVFRQRLRSGIGTIGVAMLIPIGILAVGLPIALAVRALIEVGEWLTAMILR